MAATKPLTLRSTVLLGTAFVHGTTIGLLAETAARQLGYAGPGIAQAATATVALWTLDKLNRLVDDRK